MNIKYLVLCLFIAYGCAGNIPDKKTETIRIDQSVKVKFTDLFNEYRIVFPESKDSAWFGIDIRKMEKYGTRFYFLNRTQSGNNILCFDEQGDFIFNMNHYGKGPGEYTYLGDFFIDRTRRNIVIVAHRQWLYYDMDGNYLHSIPQEDFFFRSTHDFNDNLYISFCDCMTDKDCSELLFIDKMSLNVTSSIVNNNIPLTFFTPDMPLSVENDAALYYHANDTIYDVSSNIGEKIPLYDVDFGKEQLLFKNSFTERDNEKAVQSFMTAFNSGKMRMPLKFAHNSHFIAISYAETDNAIKHKKGEVDALFRTVFYDRNMKKSYNSKNLIFDIFNSVDIPELKLLTCINGFFYATIDPILDKEDVEKIIQSKYLSEKTKQVFLKANETSNPFILIFK